jgi:hypothetical protein
MSTINRKGAKDLIPKGKFFSVCFIKRKDGSRRRMLCRTGVTKYLKGGKLAFNPDDYDLVSVFDMQKKEYRFVSLNTLEELKVGGKTIHFK